ncbi:unnamed protein product [Caenorhabditis angaria]|uniref:Uncharacterized protein n=1 Tax=Caenorhabditis angaria TaxID=860376 RepID=A0A9P1N580_9PELO|nr:unnamed protein product [Caenorhabditis angaria]
MSNPSTSNVQPTSWNNVPLKENRVARRKINFDCDINDAFSSMKIISSDQMLKPKTISMPLQKPHAIPLPRNRPYLCPANFSSDDYEIAEFRYYLRSYKNHIQRARQQLIDRQNDFEIEEYPRTSTPISPSSSTSSSTSN